MRNWYVVTGFRETTPFKPALLIVATAVAAFQLLMK
jgi:hypothetical protein